MAKQEGDPPFGLTEALYRRLRHDWIEVDGIHVRSAAIDLPQCSVERRAFTTPEATLARGRPTDVAVAGVSFENLPDRFVPDLANANPKAPPKTYELVVVHDRDGHESHCCLETRLEGELTAREPKGTMKSRIKDELAEQMRVVLRRAAPTGG